MKKKCIPLPVGMEVRFRWYIWKGNHPIPIEIQGYINKQMFPGYSYKNTNAEQLRYGITDKRDKDHSYVIPEHLITNPNIYKLYHDQDYERSIINRSHSITNNSNYGSDKSYQVRKESDFGSLSFIPKRRKG